MGLWDQRGRSLCRLSLLWQAVISRSVRGGWVRGGLGARAGMRRVVGIEYRLRMLKSKERSR